MVFFLTISPNFHSLEFSIFLSGFHQALRPKFGHFSDTMTVWWGGINHDILTFWHLIGGQFDMRKWHHYYVTYDTCAFCLSDIVTGWHHDLWHYDLIAPHESVHLVEPVDCCLHSLQTKNCNCNWNINYLQIIFFDPIHVGHFLWRLCNTLNLHSQTFFMTFDNTSKCFRGKAPLTSP